MSAYDSLEFPDPPQDRPYTLINMVATIDGKILSGERDEHVMDLGSKTDHATMRSIEEACDGVMIGAGSLRATPGLWYPKQLTRLVVSGSAILDYGSRFFTDAPERAYVVTTPGAASKVPETVQRLVFGPPIVMEDVLRNIRQDLNVSRLLVEGGSELNASLLSADLVDELFLTVAPKVKLGRAVPTYAGGDPLPRGGLLNFSLISHTVVDDELFLRYRRHR